METLTICPACKDVGVEEIESTESDEIRRYCSQCIEDLLGAEIDEVPDPTKENMERSFSAMLEEAARWYMGEENNYYELRDAYIRLFRVHQAMIEIQKNVHREVNKAVIDKMQLAVFSERPDPRNLDYFVERANKEHINVQGRDELAMKHLLKKDK